MSEEKMMKETCPEDKYENKTFCLELPWHVYVFCRLCEDLDIRYYPFTMLPHKDVFMRVFVIKDRKDVINELQRRWDKIKNAHPLKLNLDSNVKEYFYELFEDKG
jgi:hypothetical protein